MSLAKAIKLAAEVHSSEWDLAGEAYILHPLRVMFAVKSSLQIVPTENHLIAAVLHDVLETDAEMDFFIKTAFSEEVYEAVWALTRYADESYFDYIQRVSKNEIARIIKVYDLIDNTDPKRIAKLQTSKATENRLKKYGEALKMLKGTDD